MTPGALDGIVVVDFSRVLAGPYATMMLGDFGAEVIKIERPVLGDDTRHWGPPHDSAGVATYYNAVNRNKRSVALDLTDPDDVQRARELVRGADIVVENFRAGTMEKLGLGYDEVRTLRPDVIYCSITGFGRAGGADLPGYDLLLQAVGGLMSVTGTEPGDPTKVGVALVDVLAGLHALSGILAALAYRDRTGEGQRVDTNLLSVLLSSLVNQASGYVGAGVVPQMMGNRHPSVAPYQTFDTADRPIAVAVGNDKQFRAFLRGTRQPGLGRGPAVRDQSGARAEPRGAVPPDRCRDAPPRCRPLVRRAHRRGSTGRTDQRRRRSVLVRPQPGHRRGRGDARRRYAAGRQPADAVGDAGHLPVEPASAGRQLTISAW